MANQFEIGTTYEGLASLVSLGLMDPESEFIDAAESYDVADGKVKAMGSPIVTWHYGFMSAAQRVIFRTYCTTRSSAIFIRTMDNAGAYLAYSGIMVWPENEDHRATRWLDVTFEFRQLVLIVEA